MRYLGHLGVAAYVASWADSDSRSATGQPPEDLPEAPWFPEGRAVAWRAGAAFGSAPGGPQCAPWDPMTGRVTTATSGRFSVPAGREAS